ncbi:MAG TPA: EpsI family protein, partial [Syntrophaceae bacterium]|nr:EpsI family protein [Syntrophaceae bacterium]
MSHRPQFLITLLLLLSAFIYIRFLSDVRAVPLKRGLNQFPTHIGEWVAIQDEAMDKKTLDILNVDDYIMRHYQNHNGHSLWLYVGYFQDQKEGAMIHSPKHCYPGGGWQPIESGIQT